MSIARRLGFFVLIVGVSACVGSGGDSHDGSIDAPGSSAYDVLQTCGVATGCSGVRSFAQLVENSFVHVEPGTACVLRALRDRTPGLYLHETDHTWSNGSSGAKHLVIIHDNGDVTYTRTQHTGGQSGVISEAGPANRCQIKAATFFDMCVTTVETNDSSGSAWRDCTFNTTSPDGHMQWFESCEPIATSCE